MAAFLALAITRLPAQEQRPDDDLSESLGASLPRPSSSGPTLSDLSSKLDLTANELEELFGTLDALLIEAGVSLDSSETSLESYASMMREAWDSKDKALGVLEAKVVKLEAKMLLWRALGVTGLSLGVAGLAGGLIWAATH